VEPVVGVEPTTDGLQNRCSTTELNWQHAARCSFHGNTHAITNQYISRDESESDLATPVFQIQSATSKRRISWKANGRWQVNSSPLGHPRSGNDQGPDVRLSQGTSALFQRERRDRPELGQAYFAIAVEEGYRADNPVVHKNVRHLRDEHSQAQALKVAF
jgi:hypothetical protein